jgi:hypothetical protein
MNYRTKIQYSDRQTSNNKKHSCNPKVVMHPHNHYSKHPYNEKARCIAHIVNNYTSSTLKYSAMNESDNKISSDIFIKGNILTCM